MPTLTLSQYLKIGGIILGALGAIRIVYAELDVIKAHPVSLIVMGVGAAVWFAGQWEAQHEAKLAAASTSKAAVTITAVSTPTA